MTQIRLMIFVLVTFSFTLVEAQSTIGGYIITNSRDTVEVKFSVAQKKRIDKKNNLTFAEVISEDEMTRLTAKEIVGYKKGEDFYKSFKLSTSDSTFFGQLITSGQVTLYYANVFGGKYYFKKQSEMEFYELDSKSESVIQSHEDPSSPHAMGYAGINSPVPFIESNEGAFRNFFVQYFKDHQSIVNKLKQGFHTYSSIEAMFVEYNHQ